MNSGVSQILEIVNENVNGSWDTSVSLDFKN